MGLYDRPADPFMLAPPVIPAAAAATNRAGSAAEQPRTVTDLPTTAASPVFSTSSGRRLIREDLREFFTPSALASLEFTPPTGRRRRRGVVDLSAVTEDVVALCLIFRDRLAGSSPMPEPLLVTAAWIVDGEALLGAGISASQLQELIEWSTQDGFWRANILSMAKLRRHAPRLLLDPRFRQWREATGRVTWTEDAQQIMTGMAKVLDHLFPGDRPHPVNPMWGRVAERLVSRYPVVEVEDMLVWGVASRHAGRLPSLLLSEWVADAIRGDIDFVSWSKTLGRAWAQQVWTPPVEQGRKSDRVLDTVGNDDAAIAAL